MLRIDSNIVNRAGESYCLRGGASALEVVAGQGIESLNNLHTSTK